MYGENMSLSIDSKICAYIFKVELQWLGASSLIAGHGMALFFI